MRKRKAPTEVLSGEIRVGETFTYRDVRYRCTNRPEKSLNPRYMKIFVRRFVFGRTWVFIHSEDTVRVTR